MSVQIVKKFLNQNMGIVAFFVHTVVLNVLQFRRQENVTTDKKIEKNRAASNNQVYAIYSSRSSGHKNYHPITNLLVQCQLPVALTYLLLL